MKHFSKILTLISISILLSVLVVVGPLWAGQTDLPSFSIPLTFDVHGLWTFGLNFGIHPSATNGIDLSLGEQEYPPFPPPGAWYPMFRTDGGNAILDLRPSTSMAQIDTFRIGFSPDPTIYPIIFSWPNLNSYYSGSVRLKYDINGSVFDIDMKGQNSYTMTTGPMNDPNGFPGSWFITDVYIIAEGPMTGNSQPVVATYGVGNGGLQAVVNAPVGGMAGNIMQSITGSTNVWFEYGPTKSYGTSTTTQLVAEGTSANVSETFDPSSLPMDTRVHFRAVAQNALGTFYGGDRIVSNGTPPPEIAVDTTFVEVPTSMINLGHGTATWGDYDNDGDLDVLITGIGGRDSSNWNDPSPHISKIYRNDNGTFVDIEANLVGVNNNAGTIWCDYDNDGDLDLFIGGATEEPNANPVSKIYRNDNGTFVDINAQLPGVVGTASWGDFDNDADLDLLIGGSPDNGSTFLTKLYRNDNGAFVEVDKYFPGVWGASFDWGDYDNDGDLDLLLIGYGDYGTTSKLYRNDGPSQLSENSWLFIDMPISIAQVSSGSIVWGDYDNDGNLDILLSGYLVGGSGGFTTIYRNDGNGNFVDINPGLVGVGSDPTSSVEYKSFLKSNNSSALLSLIGVGSSAASWWDYDNDGDLDIVLCGQTPTGELVTKIYRNDEGTYVDIGAQLTGVWFSALAWGDYDNDGDLDLLVTGFSKSDGIWPYKPLTKIYRNNINVSNTVPTIPAGLNVQTIGSSVRMQWNRSNDNQTPQQKLTYNIRLGTVPGGNQRVSAMSDAITGYRMVPRSGNTNYNTSCTIKKLSHGTYYWSVQALDGCHAGSAFAEQQSFTIGGGVDSLKYFSFLPESLAAVTSSKIPKAVKHKNIASYWEFVLTNTGITPVTEMHIQFKDDVDFARGLENTIFSNVIQDTKKKYSFSSGEIPAGGSVRVKGYCVKAKPQQIKKYWLGPVVTRTPTVNIEPVTQRFLLPMPNYTNVIEEVFSEGGFDVTGGMLIGKVLVDSKAGGWVLMKKAGDVTKSLRDNDGIHKDGPSYFDLLNKKTAFTGKKDNLPPKKHNNKLFSELIAFKLGIAASVLEKTKIGFGELKYNDPGNPLHDSSLANIATLADQALTNKVGDINNLYYVIRRIDSAFAGPLDTISFGTRIVLKASKLLSDVPFLKEDPLASLTKITPRINNNIEMPEVFTLQQNYPNPFNPSTTIQFELASDALVTVKVYNTLGQEIAVLANREEFTEGTNELEFDGSSASGGLPSGVYFYRIVAEDLEGNGTLYTSVKKMILMK